jgi:drug/metabolite transporter (DMT)-like permease
VRARRWAATIIGFLGVLIIVRPGIDSFDLGTALMLMSAGTTAMSVIIVKRLTRTESATAIVAWLTLVLVPLSLLFALPFWTWPGLSALGWLAGLGICGVMGHWCVARAFGAADASLVMVFDYVRLPITACVAYIFFDEHTDVWTWAGAAIIAAASIYTAHREAKLHRARIAAASIAQTAEVPADTSAPDPSAPDPSADVPRR